MTDYSKIKEKLSALVQGEIFDDADTLKVYSIDASLFAVTPSLIVWPKSAEDVQSVVKFVAENKDEYPELSVTVRAAGSCMSGGSLNDSIILDVSKHLNKFSIDKESKMATVEPGLFYRDFEVETLKQNLLLPCFTASKNLCALGGMIGNNCAGEKTLRYGKMENYVKELDIVLADGNKYTIKALNRNELLIKSHEKNILGDIYEKMMHLLEVNKEDIRDAKPKISKNSAGYYLWNIENNNNFDLNKIIVGSQGTLGIVTSAKIALVDVEPFSRLVVIFMKSLDGLGEVVNSILESNPESVESYDDSTLKFAMRFMPEMIHSMKAKNFLKMAFSFLPEVKMVLTGGIPKLVLLVEFCGKSELEIYTKIKKLEDNIKPFNLTYRLTKDRDEAEKYWTIRRESFSLLRKHVRGRRTAPFIDDIIVEPKHLPIFLPEVRKILDEARLLYTIAGHAGNGNFHIIPLMDMTDSHNKTLIPVISDKIYDLVARYGGSITAEHNDGIVRTPYLSKMYSDNILGLFKDTKKIFDPKNIFNPGKKVPSEWNNGGSIEFMNSHFAD